VIEEVQAVESPLRHHREIERGVRLITALPVLAIFAHLAGKHFGQSWLDPFMGSVGAAHV
jgi:hypothetical protein